MIWAKLARLFLRLSLECARRGPGISVDDVLDVLTEVGGRRAGR